MVTIYESVESAAGILQRRIMSTVEDVPEVVLESIKRVFGEALTPETAVARLMADVRARGDDALREWTERIDGVTTQALEIPKSVWVEAHDSLSPELRGAMERAAERIRDFHARQPIPSWTSDEMGGLLGQRLVPLGRVGVYVPGGTAPLPSSLLMAAIPARVAGVDEVIVCTPADRQTGQPSPLILAAAQVAATETVVVADDSADPRWVAADLLAQAEHDVLATAILLTPSRALAEAVQAEVARQAERLTRADTIEISLVGQGGIVLTPDLATAVAVADAFAPEHLCLSVADVETWVPQIRNAGGIFLGEHSFEVLGDYVAGPSHIMPTGGSARFKGPVNVLDFVKVINLIGLTAETASALAVDADRIARAESLTAHAAAARWRIVSGDEVA